MARQVINIGTTPGDGTGDSLRAALDKCNDNFVELYESAANAASQDELDDHLADTNNPHGVTKSQVGLSNADNTSDLQKPISTATQAALNLKLDANHASVTNARTPTGGAGGVLSGTYPNPGFAVDMATQAELDALAAAKADVTHTHGNASSGSAGFMSAADKSKLDGIASGANNYTLPAPTPTVMGGVKRNAGTAGQFVNGIASDGSLTFGTPAGGGSTITTPKVLHVTTAGNDTTGDGSLGAPFLTGTKAFTVALALTGQNVCIQFGVGDFTCLTSGEVWPARIAVRGMGPSVTTLALSTDDNVVLWSDRSIAVAVTAVPSVQGGNGPSVTFYNVHGSIFTQGNQGATGVTGDPGGMETPSGDGGAGFDGGTGGNIALIDSFCAFVETAGGAGGEGGPPGSDGGGGVGNAGPSGNAGSRGGVLILRSHVTSLSCASYDMGCSNIYTVNDGTVGSDYGGNSNMPVPSL